MKNALELIEAKYGDNLQRFVSIAFTQRLAVPVV